MAGTKEVYLDYNATTPLAPEVIESITYSLSNTWSNPSSSYESGKLAKGAITTARFQVAKMLNGTPEEIVFTSGGTESNNIAFHSVLKYYTEQDIKPHVITSNIEHDSVLRPLTELEKSDKIELSLCETINGKVTIESIVNLVKSNTALVSIMLANNETGVIQPLKEICQSIEKCNTENKRAGLNRILVHTDAAQAIGKVLVDVNEIGVDYLTVVGHKFYGPRIGALYVKGLTSNYTPYCHMFYGGNQERGYRPGTENTPMIVGLGKASELVTKHINEYNSRMTEVRQYLELKLKEMFCDKIHFNSHFDGAQFLPNTCNVSLELYRGSIVLSHLKYCRASLGAACHTGLYTIKASKILLNSGIPEHIAVNAIRLSIGRDTTVEDIDIFVDDLRNALQEIK